MKHEKDTPAGIPVLSFRGHAGSEIEDGSELLEQIAVVVAIIAAFAVIGIWVGLWAINKPHAPVACAGMTPFDCVALVQEAGSD